VCVVPSILDRNTTEARGVMTEVYAIACYAPAGDSGTPWRPAPAANRDAPAMASPAASTCMPCAYSAAIASSS